MNKTAFKLNEQIFRYFQANNIPLRPYIDFDMLTELTIEADIRNGFNNALINKNIILKTWKIFDEDLSKDCFICGDIALGVKGLGVKGDAYAPKLPFCNCYLTEEILSQFEIREIFIVIIYGEDNPIIKQNALYKDGYYFIDFDCFLSYDDAEKYYNNIKENRRLLSNVKRY